MAYDYTPYGGSTGRPAPRGGKSLRDFRAHTNWSDPNAARELELLDRQQRIRSRHANPLQAWSAPSAPLQSAYGGQQTQPFAQPVEAPSMSDLLGRIEPQAVAGFSRQPPPVTSTLPQRLESSQPHFLSSQRLAANRNNRFAAGLLLSYARSGGVQWRSWSATVSRRPCVHLLRFPFAKPLLVLLASASAAALAGPVVAVEATVALRHGGSLSGEIAEYRKEQLRGQIIRIDPGLMLALPEVEFRKIDDDQEALAEYRRRADAVPETADAHWELSRWCNAQRMYAQKTRHLRYVLELDPNHGPARQELDYEPTGNGWVKRTALRRERGMLRDGGEWRFAEEVSMLRTEKENELTRKNWIRDLARLRTQVERGGLRGAEAMEELRGISDPLADAAVARELLSGKQSGLFRREMWIEILARLRTPTAVEALTRTAMNDASATIRDLCFEHLREYGRYRAIGYYLSKLGHSDNRVVRRAGRALSELNDPEIALELVKALKTKHREVIAPGNDTNVAMSPTGGGGMQMGGKAKVIDHYLNNPEVLTALLEVVPDGVNYQYDQDAWRLYFASRLAPSPGDLRRDP